LTKIRLENPQITQITQRVSAEARLSGCKEYQDAFSVMHILSSTEAIDRMEK